MSAGKMHDDELDTDAALVRRLLAAQFPQWARLTIEPVYSAGTAHTIYRLGHEMAVRLPRIHSATEPADGQADKERKWLPRFAPLLPLAIPAPLAMGTPGEGFPSRWSVYRWLAGEDATVAHIADLGQAARDLARFIAALRQIDTTGGPPAGEHNFGRGEPLSMRDAETRAAIASLDGALDTSAATAAWEAALQAPVWSGPPIWIHGDLQPLNLLVQQGRLSAVIDFGGLCVGDPACDLIVAWMLLTAASRDIFRSALAVDDASWARGRGWALSIGLIALPYYQDTNPALAEIARRAIAEVLADAAV